MLIDKNKRKEIIDNLIIGMPLRNVADLVMFSLEEIQREMEQDPSFKAAVNHAIAKCMEAQLNKLKDLKNWQAVAFLLQSLWPMHFGRRSRGAGKHRALAPTAPGEYDPKNLTDEEHEDFKYLLAKAHGRIGKEGDDRRLPEGNGGGPQLLP
jgi:hypothetical protein